MVAQNFSNQYLTGNNFRGQNLNGSTFFKARLDGVQFNRNAQGTATQLRGTNFEEAFLINVNAIRCYLCWQYQLSTSKFL
ncbi:MAG: hypothetical protein ACRC62_10845 [Microcoleus sp.]